MKIRLEATTIDPRIFDVLIDFTGYIGNDYYPIYGIQVRRRSKEVPVANLDKLLTTLNLRRIHWWKPEYPRWWQQRINIYRTTVISDRDL